MNHKNIKNKISELKLKLFGREHLVNDLDFKTFEKMKYSLESHSPPIYIDCKNFIGEGGFSFVFQSSSNYQNEKQFATKILKPNLLKTLGETEMKWIKKRFYKECSIQEELCKIMPDKVVNVYDYGEFKDVLFLQMELMNKTTLQEIIENQYFFSFKNKLNIIIKISEGLDQLHSTGFIHRDFKPSNVLFPKGRIFLNKNEIYENLEVKLSDYGLVKWIHSNSVDYYDGCVVGTPKYMSPEQIMTPGLVDKRTDIFSFGLVCYELMNGNSPRVFSLDKTLVLDEKTVRENKFRPLSDYISSTIQIKKSKNPTEEYFNEIIRNCLKEKTKRYNSMKLVSKELKKIYLVI